MDLSILQNTEDNMHLDTSIQKIISHDLFVGLKNVVENIDGWHDHEDVYSHSIATMERAKEYSTGNFITNLHAKEKFLSWMDEDIEGTKLSDLLILTALLHDTGKILFYTEGEREHAINIMKENGQTNCPGHGYWGATLVVPKILENNDIPQKMQEYISTLVRLHEVFNAFFFGKDQWSVSDLTLYAKAQAEGYYKETMFNSYCDCFASPAFHMPKRKMEELFNDPNLYIPREYMII